jgi:hypothetical protein
VVGATSPGSRGAARSGTRSAAAVSPDSSAATAHAEGTLEADEELDPFEAAEPEVALQRVVEADAGLRARSAELGDERGDDLEHLAFDMPRLARCHGRSAVRRRRHGGRVVRSARNPLRARCRYPRHGSHARGAAPS